MLISISSSVWIIAAGAGRGERANVWGVVTLAALPGQSACFSFPAAYLAGIADLAAALASPVTVGHCAGTGSVGLGVAVQPYLCDPCTRNVPTC